MLPEGEIAVDHDTGVVTGYSSVTPIDEGGSISVSGRTYGGSVRTEDYTVHYQTGAPTGQNENIRTDTVTNSRPGIQIYKTDWDGENYLSGAVFTLKDQDGYDVGRASYTSDTEGLVTTAYLNEGTFTLDEIRTPDRYAALDTPIQLTVTTTKTSSYDLKVTSGTTTYYIALDGPDDFYDAVPATETAMARITVKNRTVQDLKVVKEDSTGAPLAGVHFALYDQVKGSDGYMRPAYTPKKGFEDIVTNGEGVLEEITISFAKGTYYLREKAAPDGYKNLSEDLCFTIGEDGTVVIHNDGYSNWLTRDTSVPGTVSYQITIENTPLGITLRKTDENGKTLSGSKFMLCKKNDSDSFVVVTGIDGIAEDGQIDLTDKTEMTFTGMSNGDYLLSEIEPPAGHIIKTKDIYFNIYNGAVTLTDENGDPTTYTEVVLRDDNSTIVVKNVSGVPLPNTGGAGTNLIYLLGIALVVLAGAGLIYRRVHVL